MATLPPYQGRATTAGKTVGGTTKTVTTKTSNAPKGSKAFNAAFRSARKAGKAEFSFGGKRFNTKLAPTTTTTKKVVVGGKAAPATTSLKILDRQGQLQQAKTRDGRNATSGPEGLKAAQTYFDRDKTKAGSVSGRFRQTMPNTHAALKELATPAGIAEALGTAASAIPAGRALMGARAVGHAAHGVRAAFAAAPKAAATVAAKTAAPKVAVKVAAKAAAPKAAAAAPKAAAAAPKAAAAAPKAAAAAPKAAAAAPKAAAAAPKAAAAAPKAAAAAPKAAAAAPKAAAAAPKATPRINTATPVTSTRAKLLGSTSAPRPSVPASALSPARTVGNEPLVTRIPAGQSTPRTPTSGESRRILQGNTTARAAKANPELAAASRTELAATSRNPGTRSGFDKILAEAKARGLSVSKSRVGEEIGSRLASTAPSGASTTRAKLLASATRTPKSPSTAPSVPASTAGKVIRFTKDDVANKVRSLARDPKAVTTKARLNSTTAVRG